MTELTREWIVGVTAAALTVAICDMLVPDGGIKKIVKLAGGMLLLLVSVAPIMNIDSRLEVDGFGLDPVGIEERKEELMVQQEELSKSVIEDSMAAYIEDRAMEIGIVCQAHVTVVKEEDNCFKPESIELTGDWTYQQRTELSMLLEDYFEIAPEKLAFMEAKG